MVKIEHISKTLTYIVLPLIRKNGVTINVSLQYGDFIYSDNKEINNTFLRVYQQKGFVEITPENKPSNFNYFQVYKNNSFKENKICKENKEIDEKELIKKIIKEKEEKVKEEIKQSGLKLTGRRAWKENKSKNRLEEAKINGVDKETIEEFLKPRKKGRKPKEEKIKSKIKIAQEKVENYKKQK